MRMEYLLCGKNQRRDLTVSRGWAEGLGGEHHLVQPCLPTASMLSAGTPHRAGARRSPSSSTLRETTLQPPQRPGMVPQVVVDKAGDEEVAVVIAGLPPQGQRMTRCRRGRFQRLGFELLGEEVVRLALIHQQRQ